MAITKRADLIIPEILEDAVRGAFPGMKALFGTEAAIVNLSLPSTRGGDKIKVPYFGTLGEFEVLANDEGGAGAIPALTPAKLTMTADEASVVHAGKAFETSEWARMAATYADPYSEATRQMMEGFKRHIDSELIEVAKTTPSSMAVDVYSATTPRKLDYDVVVDARAKFGDEDRDIALVVVHSKVLADLRKLKDSDGRPLITDAVLGDVTRIAGVPIVVSDRLAPTTDTVPKYTSLLIKKGALVAWVNGMATVETDRDILADTVVTAVHIYYIVHRYSRLPGGTKTGVVKIIHN
jgi:hypothetical protein